MIVSKQPDRWQIQTMENGFSILPQANKPRRLPHPAGNLTVLMHRWQKHKQNYVKAKARQQRITQQRMTHDTLVMPTRVLNKIKRFCIARRNVAMPLALVATSLRVLPSAIYLAKGRGRLCTLPITKLSGKGRSGRFISLQIYLWLLKPSRAAMAA